MRYVICKIKDAEAYGIMIGEGHPSSDEEVCLTATDIMLCQELNGTLEDRADTINGTIYGSAAEVGEAIRQWQYDNDEQETED